MKMQVRLAHPGSGRPRESSDGLERKTEPIAATTADRRELPSVGAWSSATAANSEAGLCHLHHVQLKSVEHSQRTARGHSGFYSIAAILAGGLLDLDHEGVRISSGAPNSAEPTISCDPLRRATPAEIRCRRRSGVRGHSAFAPVHCSSAATALTATSAKGSHSTEGLPRSVSN